MRRARHPAGQSLLETVLVLPLVLAVLALGYWGFRRISLEGAAMSAAQAQLLRTGRGQPDITAALATSVHPGGEGVTVSGRNGPLSAGVLPFSGLSGHTASTVEVSRRPECVGSYLEPPSHEFRAGAEGTVDCWGAGSRSGRNVRRGVRALVASGALR